MLAILPGCVGRVGLASGSARSRRPGVRTARQSTRVRNKDGPAVDTRARAVRRSVAIERGVSVKVVSKALGHASIVITMDTYAHVTPAMQQDLTAGIDAALAR